MHFDFSNLSALDFEELVHDLLQHEWNIRLEIFKAGKDGGIDLRALTAGSRVIVQCKNYQTTPYATLKSRMRSEELPKLQRLRPTRYVLVTSLPLSVAQKDEIVALLAPFVAASSDIIGGTELERMLENAPAIVKRHHKLWLTSVPVLESVLHAAEHHQTRAHMERVSRKLPLFVQNEAYARALDALERARVVVVSGSPGIGKSTLADVLLYKHVADGFTPAVIRSGLSEGRKLATGERPVIFHFDDFLGQTYLGDRPDFLGRREDADLVDFVDWVLSSERHRFVLTTRDHVLADALQRSEKLRHHGLADNRCVVTVQDYRRDQRARILYNHLWFSTLPLAYRQEMLRDDFFLEVIDCEDFNPRIIEWLASQKRLAAVKPEAYQAHVRALIENPHEIWRHAHRYELSQPARDLLVTLHSLSSLVYIDDLERAFDRLHAHSIRRTNQKSMPAAWRSAMKELEGSFIEIRDRVVDFINPSVRDFMSTVIEDEPEIAIDVIGAAVRFNQLDGLWQGSEAKGPFPSVRPRLLENFGAFVEVVGKVLEQPALRWFDEADGRVGRYVDFNFPARAQALLSMQRVLPGLRPVAKRAVDMVAEMIARWELNIGEVTGMIDRAHRRGVAADWADVLPIVVAVDTHLGYARADDWLELHGLRSTLGLKAATALPSFDAAFASYCSKGLFDERWNCRGRDDYETLKYQLEQMQEKHGIDFAGEVERLDEALAELDDDEPTDSAVPEDAGRLSVDIEAEADDDALREMFSTLAFDA